MILVLGATGTVGRALVHELAARDAPFRVLVRSLGKMTFPPETQIVTGDLADPAGVGPAFHGAEAMFLLAPPTDDGGLQNAAIEQAKRGGVRRVVKLSAVGSGADAPTRLGRTHAAVEDAVRDGFPSWTILKPHWFMQNSFGFADTIRKESRFYAAMGDASIPMVDVRDVAAVAAECLTTDDHAGAEYVLTGPEPIPFARVAHELSDLLGRRIAYVAVPPDAAKQAMVAAGAPPWLADDLLTLGRLWGEGTDVDASFAVRQVAGLVPRSYRTFVRDHADAFR